MSSLVRRAAAALAVVLCTLLTTVAVPASASATPRRGAVCVALGDSYTAGPLILPQSDLFTCVRSADNYPAMLARRLHVLTFRDVSCSSATSGDFTRPQKGMVTGTNPPQYDAITRDTTLVTIGIGGNDIGLVGLATSCLTLIPTTATSACAAKDTAGGVDVYGRRIKAFAPTYGKIIDAVRHRAPHARIVLVGYPTGIRDGGCYPFQPLLPADATYVQAKIDQLNAAMKRQAERHGALYADLRTPSIGHGACALPGQRWLEGLIPLSDAAPLHPNRLGMINAATVITHLLRASR